MWAATLVTVMLSSLPEQPTGVEVPWSVTSFDASLVAEQTATATGCHVEVRRDADQSVIWQRDVCLGGKSDPKLLSADGLRLMVFASYPATPAVPTGSKEKYPWRSAPVVWLFEKGTLVDEGTAAQFIHDPTEVRIGTAHFEWLQGINKVPGVRPRQNATGTAVELEAIDGTHRVLSFRSLGLPPATLFPEERHRRLH